MCTGGRYEALNISSVLARKKVNLIPLVGVGRSERRIYSILSGVLRGVIPWAGADSGPTDTERWHLALIGFFGSIWAHLFLKTDVRNWQRRTDRYLAPPRCLTKMARSATSARRKIPQKMWANNATKIAVGKIRENSGKLDSVDGVAADSKRAEELHAS